MTGPAVRPASPNDPTQPHLLTGAEWEAAQYAPRRLGTDPNEPMAGGRILTGAEWDQAQRAPSFGALTFSALPKIASDVTRTPASPQTKGTPLPAFDITDPSTYAAPFLRQLVNPTLEHPVESTAVVASPFVATGVSPLAGVAIGATIAGTMAYHIAQYGWQKAHELALSPAERAKAEADPNRISGESAAMQAFLLGLGPLIHVGVKAVRGLDVSAGMMDAGAQGVAGENLGPTFRPGFAEASNDAAKAETLHRAVNEHASGLQQDAAMRAEVARQNKLYFETPKGAELLGTMAARHGMPETASPYPPATPLDAAWKDGHATVAPTAAPGTAPEAPAAVAPIETSSAAPGASEAPAEPIQPPAPGTTRFYHGGAEYRGGSRWVTPDLAYAKGYAEKSGAPVQYVDLPNDHPLVRDAFDVSGTSMVSPKDSFEAPPEIAKQLRPYSEATPPSAPAASGAGGPDYKGPVSLYKRLSDDALGAEYRALLDKRSAEQPNAIAPLWDAEREARAVDQIENRRRSDGSLSPADKRQLATLQAAQGEGYGEGRHTFESAAAERRVNDMTRHITAIEKEISNRGLNAEEVAQPPATSGGGLAPVEGTGELRTRGLSASVEQKAVAKDLTDYLGDLPEYRQIDMADQAAQSSKLLSENPDLARRIALGEADPPKGLIPEAVFKAVEHKALVEGDVGTLRDLASGGLTEQATTMGQRLRALADRDPESPVAAIERVTDARTRTVGDVSESLANTLKSIQAHLTKATIDPDALTTLINSLRC